MNDPVELKNRPWMFAMVRAWMLAVMSTYAYLAVHDARPVDWGAPWIPGGEGGKGWFAFTIAAVTLTWADGWLLPWFSRRKPSPRNTLSRMRWEYSAFGRFLVRVTIFHSAGVWGLALAFKVHDARYALVALVPSTLMVLLLPRPTPPTPPSAAQ